MRVFKILLLKKRISLYSHNRFSDLFDFRHLNCEVFVIQLLVIQQSFSFLFELVKF